jgi:hypothetical protein
MAVETFLGRPTHLFLAWTRWRSSGGDILMSRSMDGGATFSRPTRLASGNRDNVGAEPVVGRGGRVYVIWATFSEVPNSRAALTTLSIRRSDDDGAHFGRPHVISTFLSVPRMSQPDSLRNITFPSVVAGPGQTIHVAWAQTSKILGTGRVSADIMIDRSIDGGETWQGPKRVNDTGTGDRFMPALTRLGGGTLGIAFYDRRAGSTWLRVYAASIADGGGFRVSRNVRIDRGISPVSDITYLPPGSTCFTPGRFFGDYIGTARGPAGSMDVVWADTALQVTGETDIWFNTVGLPKPVN